MAAALQILTEAGRPLHYREITKIALERGLIETTGRTPEETLNARLAVDLKQRGAASPVVRIAPGTFGLRAWVDEGRIAAPVPTRGGRARVPHFPEYAPVRSVLPVWAGLPPERITGLHRAIVDLTGTPQEALDWSDPGAWIPERLKGEERELALATWKASGGTLNPRYMLGPWLLASGYELLREGDDGRLEITPRGRDFIEQAEGATVRELDEAEGLLRLLAILADRSPAATGDLIEPWRAFLDAESRIKSDSYARAALWQRLRNLQARGYVSRSGRNYAITDVGLAWLRQSGVQTDTTGTPEEQDIWALVQRHKERVRQEMLELLRDMDPYAFERLIARLLQEMGYENVEVTSRSHDKGVDVVANVRLGISSVREVVQAKRHKANVQRPVLDALRGSLHRFQAVRGTIITTGGFAKGTVQAAFEPGAAPITLIDGETLVDLLLNNHIGVRPREVVLLELDPSAFAAPDDEADDI
jgi:restriction system protein